MDVVRDLGQDELWQASLERSLARRTSARRPATDPARTRSRKVRRSHSRRPRRSQILLRRGLAVLALTLPGAVPLSVLAGQGTSRSLKAAERDGRSSPVPARDADSRGAGPLFRLPVPRATRNPSTPACQPASRSSDYVNPLASARVRPERIDQGVDYAGSGMLAAIGGATVTYVATTATGWPGSFIEYRLLDGPDAGCYVYYAEGVNPAAGLRVGERVAPGQPIAHIIRGWPTGIELGWGAGISTATYAAETHQWSATNDQDSVASQAGKSFSALIASLGGPPGKAEG